MFSSKKFQKFTSSPCALAPPHPSPLPHSVAEREMLFQRLAVFERVFFLRFADCQSAIRQAASLRYQSLVCFSVSRPHPGPLPRERGSCSSVLQESCEGAFTQII